MKYSGIAVRLIVIDAIEVLIAIPTTIYQLSHTREQSCHVLK
jgi:hypothetical protein